MNNIESEIIAKILSIPYDKDGWKEIENSFIHIPHVKNPKNREKIFKFVTSFRKGYRTSRNEHWVPILSRFFEIFGYQESALLIDMDLVGRIEKENVHFKYVYFRNLISEPAYQNKVEVFKLLGT